MDCRAEGTSLTEMACVECAKRVSRSTAEFSYCGPLCRRCVLIHAAACSICAEDLKRLTCVGGES